ncbi:hypothetical protein BV25DRAFT_1920607 [Artomyces pyxidatus]|uniref:Uncharacterized protein n=1 Tax=Artomyces pyxidatus TaxID=48021 RepID=A0ACB8SK89_9AGAM|nr:hypothetical protein BV25DRAFT_1920607 [Artomyces pyxidatus]
MRSRNVPPGPVTIDPMGVDASGRLIEELLGWAHHKLHLPVHDILKILGITGRLAFASEAMIGKPDLGWTSQEPGPEGFRPKAIVDYALDKFADFIDLPACFARQVEDKPEDQHSLRMLHHLYGCMVFNDITYGILCNWKRAVCFKRLDIDGVEAFVGIAILAQSTRPQPPVPPLLPCKRIYLSNVTLLTTHLVVDRVRKTYPLVAIDARLCRFQNGGDRSAATHELHFRNGRSVQCKVVDMVKSADLVADKDDLDLEEQELDVHVPWLTHEVKMYAALEALQGVVIPMFCGFYSFWGVVHVLAAMSFGEKIDVVTPTTAQGMIDALTKLHDAGYLLGDVQPNACRRSRNEAAMGQEIRQVY